jgi:hypothetical protein
MPSIRQAKFSVGDVVRHRFFPFRGLIFDIDPVFANTEEWWLAIPAEIRPRKDQPYYHVIPISPINSCAMRTGAIAPGKRRTELTCDPSRCGSA